MMNRIHHSDSYILIVDDQALNIRVLGNALKSEFQVRFATSGAEALEMIRSAFPPDLILLDIMMPDLDGYQVCQQLKSDPKTKNIPIIFVTVKDTTVDQSYGFSLGAVDYITKPFKREIITARVRTHLELKRHRDNIEQHLAEKSQMLAHKQLELEKKIKENELVEELLFQAQKMANLGDMVAEIVHEISNPASNIVLNVDTVQSMWEKIKPILMQTLDDDEAELFLDEPVETFSKNFTRSFELILQSIQKIRNIIEELKNYYRKTPKDKYEYLDINAVIDSAIKIIGHMICQATSSFSVEYGRVPYVQCCYQHLEQALINLIQNACQAIEKPDRSIRIRSFYQEKNNSVMITIEDEGVGIAEEVLAKIYEPYFTTKKETGGSGIGLSISIRLLQQNKGRLTLSSEEGKSTVATIYLPAVWSHADSSEPDKHGIHEKNSLSPIQTPDERDDHESKT